MPQADYVIVLTDGGNGLEEFFTTVLASLGVKNYQFILDFWHAAEHLEEFAKVWIPNATTRKVQVETWCHKLKYEGGAAILKELEALDLTAASAAVQEEHRLVTNYLRNNRHRTDYPTYLKNGWEIGSGEIESACKGLIGLRLKGPGMRWHEPGTNEMSHLRGLYKGDPRIRHDYWLHRQHHPRPKNKSTVT